MLIDSVLYKNSLYSTGSTNYLIGNVGDLVSTEITFTVSASATAFDFYFNLIGSDEKLYNGIDYSLPDSVFQNKQNGKVQAFRGGIGTLAPANPKSAQVGTAIVSDLGANQYKITYVFFIAPYFRPEDQSSNDFVSPGWFNGLNTLRPIFRIDCRSAVNDPIVFDSTSTQGMISGVDIASYAVGNVGFFNERFNGGTANFVLVDGSLDFGANDSINPTQETQVKFQIKNNTGLFTTNTTLVVYALSVVDSFSDTQTFNENQRFERVPIVADGTGVDGLNNYLLDCLAAVNSDTTLIDVSFRVAQNSYTEDFLIFVSVQNNIASVADANHNNIFIWTDTAGAQINTENIIFDTYPNAPTAEFNFNYHFNNDITQSYNHVKSYVDDRCLCRFSLSNADKTNTVISSFTVGIRRKEDAILESQVFQTVNLPISVARNWKIGETDEKRNFLAVKTTNDLDPTDNYIFDYPFQILPAWTAFADIVFYCIVSGTQNGIAFEIELKNSPFFELQTYDITKNVGSEPIVLAGPERIKYFDAVTNAPASFLIKGRDTLVVAYFQENNKNDLEREEEDLTGHLNINYANGSNVTLRQFHDRFLPELDTPWIAAPGGSGMAKIDKIAINRATVSGIISWNKLISAFPNATGYDISARLDSVQPLDYSFYTIDFHYRSEGLLWLSWQVPESLGNAQLFDISADLPLSSFIFKTSNNNTTWGAQPNLNQGQFISEVATLNSGDWIYIETQTVDFVEGGIILRYLKSVATTNPQTITINVPQLSIDVEDTMWLQGNDFVLTSSTADFIAFRDSTSNDFTSGFLPVTAPNLTTVNDQIAALSPSEKYGIQVVKFPVSNTAFSISTTGNYTTSKIQKIAHVGSSSRPGYGLLEPTPGVPRQALRFDGGNDKATFPGATWIKNMIAQNIGNYFYGNKVFTISFDVRRMSSIDFFKGFHTQDTLSGVDDTYYCGINNGVTLIGNNNNAGVYGKVYPLTMAMGRWYNITAVNQGSTMSIKIYADKIDCDSVSNPIIFNSPLKATYTPNICEFGAKTAQNLFLPYDIANFVFSTHPATPQEVSKIYHARGDKNKLPDNIANNLVVCMDFNQISGGAATAIDNSGNGNNATITGQPTTTFVNYF